jgi:uncharacterized protein YutE (UPF0331/DUF86 family)
MIRQKIVLIQKDLSELAAFKNATTEEIAANYRTHKAVERMMEVIINEAIDINQHCIVRSGKGELPFDFRQSFLLMADLGIYPKDFAQEIAKSVGIRNILVHQYRKLDERLFNESIKDCLEQYTKYCSYVISFLGSR